MAQQTYQGSRRLRKPLARSGLGKVIMATITVELKDCSIHDANQLIEQIKKNKYVQDAYLVQSVSGLTKRAPDALRSDNIRNIRPPKYAPGDKRGKNARR